jgi:hypothetical protein
VLESVLVDSHSGTRRSLRLLTRKKTWRSRSEMRRIYVQRGAMEKPFLRGYKPFLLFTDLAVELNGYACAVQASLVSVTWLATSGDSLMQG